MKMISKKAGYMAIVFLAVVAISTCSAQAATTDISSGGLTITMINQNPDPAEAGQTVELRFMVENSGSSDLNNINIEFVPSYPFVAIPGENYARNISKVSAYQTGSDAYIIKYNVMVDRDAVRGNNTITLKAGQAGSDITVTKTFPVDVTGTEFAQVIYVDKAKISPGQETPIKFTITNVGNSPLKNLVFSWNEPEGVLLPVYSDDTKYVKFVDVGDSVDLEYTVVADVNADPGLYKLNLDLSYETNSGVSQDISTQTGIFIGGETNFDVTFSESSAGQTSLSVANTGNNPAFSVTVRVPQQQGFRATGSSSSIVGNLDKGDYTIVSFAIASTMGTRNATDVPQGPGSQGTANQLLVNIDYTDTTGVRHTVEKYVPIQASYSSTTTTTTDTTSGTSTYGFRQRSSSTDYVIYAVVTGVVAVGGYLFYRRRKKKKAASKKQVN